MEEQPAFLADLLPPLSGESIYSVCARVGSSARAPARATSLWLLGHPAGAARHELTFGLRHLEKRYGGTQGPLPLGQDLVRRRTALGAVFPFLSPDTRREVVESLGEPVATRLTRQKLGVRGGRESLGLVLRRCPLCEAKDIAELNLTYWRSVHQFAGVWVCPWHLCPLVYLPERGLKIQEWNVAHRSSSEFQTLSLDSTTQELLTRVMSCVIWCASHVSLGHSALIGLVRARLQASGLSCQEAVTTSAECKDIHEAIAAKLARHDTPHFRQFCDEDWVRKTLTARGFSHPLRWAVLIASTLPEAWHLPASTASHRVHDGGFSGHIDLGLALPDDLEAELVLAWRKSPQLQLFKEGTQLRARHAPTSLYDALSKGAPLADAASQLGLDVMRIKHWLRKDPDLARHWRARKTSAWVAEARLSIERFLSEHPDAHRTAVLYACTGAHRLLERYAPEVLQSLLPPVQSKYSRQVTLPFE